MLFDTDILIWVQRGNIKAARIIDETPSRNISILTYMELLQNARDKKQHQIIKAFIKNYGFNVVPLTENIGHRAAIYVEEYTMSSGLRSGDAIIAATAVENNESLTTGNTKHFKAVKELDLVPFRP